MASSAASAEVARPSPPARRIDPVGNLAVALDCEAGDGADQTPIDLHCSQGVGLVIPDSPIMSVERVPVRWVVASEGGQVDRERISLPLEHRVEICVDQTPKS
jgi:hypothetical protein